MPGFILAPGADAAVAVAAQSDLERDLALVAGDLADSVLLVVGEITANALEHGTGEVTVTWSVTEGAVRLDVLGPGPDTVQIRAATLPPDEATRGRGLFLIQTLATTVEAVEGGIRICFEPDES